MTASANQPSADEGRRSVATNRKAHRDYVVLETLEAGLELRGSEVKSLRAGRVNLSESYGRVEHAEVFLHQLDIQPYEHGSAYNPEPRRVRRLLLHRHEIKRLIGQTALKGHALIPLRLYFRRGRAKIEIAVCKGKHTHDKRETIRRRTADREAARAISAHTKR